MPRSLSSILIAILAVFSVAAGTSGNPDATSNLYETGLNRLSVRPQSSPGTGFIVAIDGKYLLTLSDRTGDGEIDWWSLVKDGKPYCDRWARSGEGMPDAAEVFGADGESEGIVVWGHAYGEEEAETVRKRLDEEIGQLESDKPQER